LLYLMLKRVILPRLRTVIEGRQERMRDDLAEAETLRAATAQALMGYEAALADARAKASGFLNATRDKVKADSDEERAKAQAQISAKISAAELRIGEAKARALVNVEDIALDVAGAIVAHVMGKEVGKTDIERAVLRNAAQ
jgi:F-type H+-transporting ATPase subunit b